MDGVKTNTLAATGRIQARLDGYPTETTSPSREMFGIKLRPASQNRTSASSVSSDGERNSSTDKSSAIKNSVNNIGGCTPGAEAAERDKEHKRPPIPLPRSTSLGNKGSSVLTNKDIKCDEDSGGSNVNNKTEALPSKQSGEVNSSSNIRHQAPLANSKLSSMESKQNAAAKIQRQNFVEKDKNIVNVRKPPSFKPPPPPVNLVKSADKNVALKTTWDRSRQHTESPESMSNSALDTRLNVAVILKPETENQKTIPDDLTNKPVINHLNIDNQDKTEGAEGVVEENNNKINSDLSDKTEEMHKDVDVSQVKMRRSVQRHDGGSPVQMRRSSNRKDPEPSGDGKSNDSESFEDVDTSHVVMRRSRTTSRPDKSVSDISTLSLPKPKTEESEDEVFKLFDEGPFHNIFTKTEKEHRKELPIELCLDAYKKLKAYLERNDKYFDLDSHTFSVDNPVMELNRLLSKSS